MRILELTHQLMAPNDDIGLVLNEILEAGLDVLNADSGSIWLFDDSTQQLEMYLPETQSKITVLYGEGLVGECLATNEIINVRDCYADARFNSEIDKITGYRTKSILSIPLVGFEHKLVGVIQLLNKTTGPFNLQDEALARTLAAQCAVALQRMQMMESLLATERLNEEFALAREIQQATLPDAMPELEGYDFSGGFIPADHTGGDLFDLVSLGDEVFILLGDATGHGFGPALSATRMQGMLRVALRVGANLDKAYIHVNNQLVEDLPDNKFLTAFVGFLNKHSHVLRYHSGGQGPLAHVSAANDNCQWHAPTSFPVGVMELEQLDEPREVLLAPGDIFAVISDGVYEYHNEQDEQFGEDRVADILTSFSGQTMDELKDQLLQAVFSFGGEAEQLDDITIVLIRRNPL